MALTLLSRKTLSNLPDRMALGIQSILWTQLKTHANNNISVYEGMDSEPDLQFSFPKQNNVVWWRPPLKNRLLCRYDQELFMLIGNNYPDPITINAYKLNGHIPQEIQQGIGSTFFTTDKMEMSRGAFQKLMDEYIHESLPRTVQIWPVSLHTHRKSNILPKTEQREKRKKETEITDRQSLEKTIRRIQAQQDSITQELRLA